MTYLSYSNAMLASRQSQIQEEESYESDNLSTASNNRAAIR